jgi:hypothetical protein
MLLIDPYDAVDSSESLADLNVLTLPTFDPPPALSNDLEWFKSLYHPWPEVPPPLPDYAPPDSSQLIGWTPTTVDVAAR